MLKKKLLIIRLSSIGDIVLTTPVIRCLKQQTDFEVHYLTKFQYADVLKNNPYIDELHLLKDDLYKTAIALKKQKFDIIIDLHKNIRTQFLKTIINAKQSYAFNKINMEKWLAVNLKKINILPQKHIVDRYFETTKNLSVTNDNEGLDYFITDDDYKEALNKINLQTQFMVWAIGAQHYTKRFPVKKIAEVLNNINLPVVLLGDKHDAQNAPIIIGSTQNKNIINACGKLSINQSAAIVKQAKFVVSNDTGLMHIAAAFKKPIISIWGNTIPQFGMYPYYGKHSVQYNIIQTENLKCRPCSKIGFKKCPKKHFNCMNKIETSYLENVINIFAQQ
ncbi:MAG: glycosyltransferase family 9 protein [Bacteroidia bacterium]